MKGANNRSPPRVWSSCRAAVTEARLVSIESQVSIPGVRRIRGISSGGPRSPHTYVRVYVLSRTPARRVTDNLSDVTSKENTHRRLNGSMGNGGINNRKSPCPLRAIKLQAIFFRRIPISLSHSPCLASLHLTSPTSTTSDSPPHPLFQLLRHPLAVTTYLVSILPTLLFVLGIYVRFSLALSLSLFLSLRLSPPFYILDALPPSSTLARSACFSLSLLFVRSLALSCFLLLFLSVVPFPLATLSNRAGVLRRVEDLPLITLTPFHNSVPPPPDARFSLNVFFFIAFLPFLPGQPGTLLRVNRCYRPRDLSAFGSRPKKREKLINRTDRTLCIENSRYIQPIY